MKVLFRYNANKEFINRIYNRDGGIEYNPHRKEYLKVIEMVDCYFNIA